MAAIGPQSGDAPRSVFLLMVSGQIETADFAASEEIYCQYNFCYGPDWAVTLHVGPEADSGSSQVARRSMDRNQHFVFNFPIEITFRSTNPHGWPQLVLSCFGTDMTGNEIPVGYGICHCPTTPGQHKIKVALFTPESSSIVQKILSMLEGKRPEYHHPKFLAKGYGREVTRVSTQGYVTLSFNVILKDMKKFGYDVGEPQRQSDLNTETIINQTLQHNISKYEES